MHKVISSHPKVPPLLKTRRAANPSRSKSASQSEKRSCLRDRCAGVVGSVGSGGGSVLGWRSPTRKSVAMPGESFAGLAAGWSGGWGAFGPAISFPRPRPNADFDTETALSPNERQDVNSPRSSTNLRLRLAPWGKRQLRPAPLRKVMADRLPDSRMAISGDLGDKERWAVATLRQLVGAIGKVPDKALSFGIEGDPRPKCGLGRVEVDAILPQILHAALEGVG